MAYQTAWRILGQAQDCEDVLQESFLEAHRLYAKREVKHWPAFLKRLVTFRSLDLLRRRKDLEPIGSSHVADSQAGPVQSAIVNEQRTRLRELVGELPERQAAVFCLLHYEEKSVEEVAEILEISSNAVSMALFKARKKLRNVFLQHVEESPNE